MANTVQDEVLGVRGMLNAPLPQSPSYQDILDELEAEYQHITNSTNSVGNSWQVANYTLTTQAGVYDYAISPSNDDFFKALNVTTVPDPASTDPQYLLEFTELENIPKEWSWISSNKGQYLYSSHDSQVIAFYRQITPGAGATWRCQIRPVPSEVQEYNILYQVTDWWNMILTTLGTSFPLPHSSQRFYIRALAAQNLLLKGTVMWSFSSESNEKIAQSVSKGLDIKLARYKEGFDEYRSSLDNPDVTYVDCWADDYVQV